MTAKERVIKEREELEDKMQKLFTFLDNGKPDAISDLQWAMLNTQYHIMVSYFNILSTRLNIWED